MFALRLALVLLAACEKAEPPAPQGLPQSCLDYEALLDKYASCPGIPPSIRTTVDKLKQNWSQLGSATQPPAVDKACRDGAAAIRAAIAQFHC